MGITTNLILGGSGLIGKELQKQLLRLGEEVINLDIKEGVDLRSYSLEKYKETDYIWFLAWDSGGAKYLTNKNNFLNIYKNNTSLFTNIFSFIEKYNKPFLFTSSQLAATDTPYGLTKLYAEKWTELLGGKIVRMWNVYGWEEPDERSHVLPDLIVQALIKSKIELMTNGEEQRQFIYVEDCVKNLIQIRTMKETIFTLTNGNWIKIKDMAAIIADELKISLSLGKEKGYENLIEPFNIEKFSFNHSLQSGINKLTEAAHSFLQKQITHEKGSA